jgi:N,N'-diacetylchitobiose phosphorylase
MIIDPCIPRDWKSFQVRRKWRGVTFDIRVANLGEVEKGVKEIRLDGRTIKGPIPVQPPGSVHSVEVLMG